MKINCGIDIVDNERVQNLLFRRSESSLLKIWTRAELDHCTDKNNNYIINSLAVRFACKEAFAKAVGTGFKSLDENHSIFPSEIEISNDYQGAPFITLFGNTRKTFEFLGYTSVSVSLTHTEAVSAAVCIIYSEEKQF